ncbi:unnamed protein product [Prorocentrum cordatum]|uniref:RRM domain-containing protein n=1 Tax=Prorocentrum cordatum TaxID=2364126 RepID=A0ABN9SWS8_9DINO|nr:unnamed protein product [Polarella glacialis]
MRRCPVCCPPCSRSPRSRLSLCNLAAASPGRPLTSSTTRAGVCGQRPEAATHPNTLSSQPGLALAAPPQRPRRGCNLSPEAFRCSTASRCRQGRKASPYGSRAAASPGRPLTSSTTRAGVCGQTRGSHPSENAQQSAWVGLGGAPSAAEARPPSQPGGVPLLHGQPLPPGQEGIPIWKSSGGESWKTVDEFDHPRGRLRAETRFSHPSENAQQSAWVGLGGAPSAAEARPPSQPGGVPLLHGQPLPPGQEGIPIWKSSGGESWKTVDEFDHPRGRLRAETRGSHPSENAQQSAWVGLGGAPSAAEARPQSQPGGVPLLHGQPLPPGQEGIPIWKSSGGESWKTVDEFDHPRGRLRAETMPRRSAAETGLAAGPLGEWSVPARSAHARAEPDRAARAGASSGTSGAARTLQGMRARLLEQEQLLAEAEQQTQEVRRRIWEQEADLLELEVQQGELAGSVPAPTEEAVPATPGAPAVTTVMISNIPMAVAQNDLLDLINRAGFANRYDYAYMPITFEAGTTKGIAFVNFATPRDAREFSKQWNGATLTGAAGASTNGAVIEVRASALQGYVENTRRWTASRLRRMKNPEFHPFIVPRPAA